MNDNWVDGVLGTQNRGGRIEGTDKSIELWQDPTIILIKPFYLSLVDKQEGRLRKRDSE